MRILLSGASGFIGKALSDYLTSQGQEVTPLPKEGLLDSFDAVIHLAGEPIATSRWTTSKRSKDPSVALRGTERLIQRLSSPPKVFICASAVGYYGDRDDEVLTETSGPGKNFLSYVCTEWEKTSDTLKHTRVVHARFGIVLGPNGGALQRMILPYKLGLGAILGSGKQWVSWVERSDLIRAIDHIIKTETLVGPINIVAPESVRQKEFATTLAKALHRIIFLRLPAPIVRLIFGQMGEELFLASQRAKPEKLETSGFHFDYPTLKKAIENSLRRTT